VSLLSVIEGLKYMQSHEVLFFASALFFYKPFTWRCKPVDTLFCLLACGRYGRVPCTLDRYFFTSDADVVFVLAQWAKVEGDIVTVGITDHAQAELGDVVYVELPEVGSTVSHKATFGVVESVKVRFLENVGKRTGSPTSISHT
jgi:hypothetical protein